MRGRPRAVGGGALVMVAWGLTACGTYQPTTGVAASNGTSSWSVTTGTAGVPTGVLDLVAQVRAVPGDRAIGPAQWVRTTYATYRRMADGPGHSWTAAPHVTAADAAEVYVVQLGGDFASLDPATPGRRYRFTVVVAPSELPMSAAEAVRQSDQALPLADLGVVGTFPLP